MMPGSPRICLERCDEDIDLLSELLDNSSDEVVDDRFDLSNGLLSNDVDEFTNYLCRSSKRSVTLSPVDPCLSSVSADESPSSPSHSSMDTQRPDPVTVPVSTESSERAFSPCTNKESKTIVMFVPKSEPCMTKNAVNARENRQRKKQYVHQLENDTANLKKENSELKVRISSQDETIEKLNEQVQYLTSVIANQSTLSALLKNIHNTSGVRLKSSLSTKGLSEVGVMKSSPKNQEENQENKSHRQRSKRKCVFESERLALDKRIRKENVDQNAERNEVCGESLEVFNKQEPKAGVCLHVSGEDVSLEFCVTCSKMAASSRVLDDHSYVLSPLGS